MDDFLRRLDEGFPIDGKDSKGNTLLHVACQNDHLDIVEILVAHGTGINAQNNTGQTAMHFAKYYEYDEIFSYLKSMGADDSIRNHDGFTCYEGLHEDED